MSARSGWTVDHIPDLSGRRALVTGATGALGAVVVEVLARKGAEVVMAGRNEARLSASVDRIRRALPDARLRPLVLDLAAQSSVRTAAAEAATYGRLDLLVNNAFVRATPYLRTVDGFELQMATNFLGHFALTGLLLPQLVVAGGDTGSRVVSIASQAHRLVRSAPLQDPRAQEGPYRAWATFAQTTLANLLFTGELDRRAREAGLPVKALAAHPGLPAMGPVASRRRRQARGAILDAALAVLAQPPSQAALPVLMAATADLPGATYVGPGGVGELRGGPQVVTPTRLARDPETAGRLWELAEDATGVVYP